MSERDKGSERMDAVLRRMLSMPPGPHKAKPKKAERKPKPKAPKKKPA